jgi:hypothetical protein
MAKKFIKRRKKVYHIRPITSQRRQSRHQENPIITYCDELDYFVDCCRYWTSSLINKELFCSINGINCKETSCLLYFRTVKS